MSYCRLEFHSIGASEGIEMEYEINVETQRRDESKLMYVCVGVLRVNAKTE